MPHALHPGSTMPEMTLPLVGGGDAKIGGSSERWQAIVIYRGKHCPLCNKYLNALNGLLADFDGIGVDVIAVSGEPQEKAEASAQEWGLKMPVAYGLSMEQMHTLGLYVSEPRSAQETDQPFNEPGLFVVRPDGTLQIIDISNAPFARPDMETIKNGLNFIMGNDYPIRGTLNKAA